MRVPASLVALPLLAGCAAGMVAADRSGEHAVLCGAAGALLALLAAIAWLDQGAPEVVAAVATGSLLAGFSLGVADGRAAYDPPLVAWFESLDAAGRDAPWTIEGVLREDAAGTLSGVSLALDVRTPARGGLRVVVTGAEVGDRLAAWRRGRTVRASVLVRRPVAFRDPGVPDDVRALARRGIALVGSIKSAALVDVVSRGSRAAEAAASVRAFTRRALAQHVGRWSAQSAGLATAILIGDRSGLANEDERRLQEAGTYHVVAISGGNIAILTALLLGVLRAIGVGSRAGSVVTMALLVSYGQLAGASPSVERAVAAAVVYLTARVIDHRGSPVNGLAVAAIWALATSPRDVFDAGFVLSFGATIGILIGARGLFPPARRGRFGVREVVARLVRTAVGLVAATACADAALVPVSASVFSRITFAGLALNLVAIPCVTVVQVASTACLVAAPFSAWLAGVSGLAAHLAAAGIVGSARVVDVMPWLSRDVVPPAWWVCGVYYAAASAALWRGRVRLIGLAGMAVSAACMLWSPAAASRDGVPRPSGSVRVVFLDVGQGDATLVQLPGGADFLIDAGGLPGSSLDVGERVVVPAVRAFGVRRLDTLVLTHGDPDHVGGAAAVLRRLKPGTVWEGIPVPPHEGLRALSVQAAAQHATWRNVQAGDVERVSAGVIRVLHPAPADWERQRVRNDDSIVLEVRYGDVSIVLPGDIGQAPERLISSRPSLAPTVILKAPHHGSATSSSREFLAAARPSAVVFSAGTGNRFGHPVPSVVARYVESGAAVFGPDDDGAVIVDTDGTRVEIRAWTGRRLTIRP